MYLILGGVLAFSQWTAAAAKNQQTTDPALTIGSYRIVDTTHLYPKPNFYEQYMDCAGVGGAGTDTNAGLGQNTTPLPSVGNSSGAGTGGSGTDLPVILPGIGSAGSSTTVPTTGSDSGGVIPMDPVGNDNSNNTGGIGTGIGGIGGIGGSYTPGYGTTDPGITLDKIVNIGYLVWQVVEMGRPNVKLQSYRAHALPKGIACWTDLENWQIPTSKVFSVEYKNLLGQVVAVYSYRISFVYGGNVNGVGKYIANLTVTPVDMRVSWGFNFSSQVQIPSTFNMGKKSDPLAAMQVFVLWSIGNSLKVEQRSNLYYVTGDGRIQKTE